MEEMYGLHQSIDYGGEQTTTASLLTGNMVNPVDYQSLVTTTTTTTTTTTGGPYRDRGDRLPMFGSDHNHHHHHFFSSSSSSSITPVMMIQEDDINSTIKAKIASHPRYPTLLEAYIDCQKVGAPPEIVGILEEIRRENNNGYKRHMVSTRLGADPELDEFMETYCEILVKYKSDLSRPFDEATAFLNKIELQLSSLCKPSSRTSISDEVAGSSDDDSGNDIDVSELQPRSEERDLKDKLLRKYSGYISSLKHEFSKKKKKGKLPKEARQSLLDWWNMHYKWPYPTEADKIQLAESTGLDQKQINNWFINQRKRHWKPSENMQFAVMDSISAPFFIDD